MKFSLNFLRTKILIHLLSWDYIGYCGPSLICLILKQEDGASQTLEWGTL